MQVEVGSVEVEQMTQGLLATGTDGTLFETAWDREASAAALREAAAARVAAHRSKRAGAQAVETARDEALKQEQARVAREARRGASKVRDAVKARYEHSTSYRDFLAAEAERAVEQARAEAEVAARKAKAIADAQMQLLEELRQEESAGFEPGPALVGAEEDVSNPGPRIRTRGTRFEWDEGVSGVSVGDAGAGISIVEEPAARVEFAPEFVESGDLFAEAEAAPVREVSNGGLTVRLYEDVPVRSAPELKAGPWVYHEPVAPEELEELEQEIAFRRAPEFLDHVIETLPLPANLIEFPRELVAAKKARPRLAEGPLREEMGAQPQLRIFEVEPEQISIEPVVTEEAVAEGPVWQGVMLDARPRTAVAASEAAAGLVDAAPISRRVMAAMVDGCCIGLAMVGFATVTAYVSGPRLQGMSKPMMAAAAAFTFAIAALVYQFLFFWLNEATPGMRYARIGLCTFAEENPTRKQMRRRVMAQMLAVGPLGLGVLWAWMDDDRLTWHDRISRMYQRVY